MNKHNLDNFKKSYDGIGYSIWKCKKCGMEITRLMGRFLKFDSECIDE